ncbi:hypothetical protein BLA29_009817 [Euroglyphus maynei]|uniref:Uncharacterized protein n=1 Tax=Euroglyphus maynei TaxID=6958 RepID=A0A1Y3ALG0_EURMA|nr:hypothetical protein BLA29_009817 [Euroglyphus maynei]
MALSGFLIARVTLKLIEGDDW